MAECPNLIDELLGDQVKRPQALLRAGQHDGPLTGCDEHRGEPRGIGGLQPALLQKVGQPASPRSKDASGLIQQFGRVGRDSHRQHRTAGHELAPDEDLAPDVQEAGRDILGRFPRLPAGSPRGLDKRRTVAPLNLTT